MYLGHSAPRQKLWRPSRGHLIHENLMLGTDLSHVRLLTNAIGEEEVFAFDRPTSVFKVGEECTWGWGYRESGGKHLLTLSL